MKKKVHILIVLVLLTINSRSQTYKDVAGIFYSRCATCHNQNHQYPFLNYTQTKFLSSAIWYDLTTSKMPPWPPDTTYSRFAHEHLITPSEKNSILAWLTAGAQKGDTTLAPPPPSYPKYRLHGTPDLELKIPNFESNAFSKDSYVCFSISTGLTQDRILRAYEIIPGDPSMVHHIIMKVDPFAAEPSNLSGSCFDQPGVTFLGSYTPGAPPMVFPGSGQLKMGITINAWSNIIVQVHYPLGSAGKVDSTKIRLYFYPPQEPDVRPVQIFTQLQNWSIDLPAHTTGTYEAVAPFFSDVSLVAIWPHSHKLATQIRSYAFAGTDTTPLINIKDWDFNFQGFYTFKFMPRLIAPHIVYSKHIFDNTTANTPNPVHTTTGYNSSDEMFSDAIQFVDYREGDELIDVAALLKADTLLAEELASGKIFSVYAFPNPFENSVRIGYILNESAEVNIQIHSVIGSAVRNFQNGFESPGAHEITWDGKTNGGNSLPPGIYFYSIRAGSKSAKGKLVLMPGAK